MSEFRNAIALALGGAAWMFLWTRFPFPDPVTPALALIYVSKPQLYTAMRYVWATCLFCLPLFYIVLPLVALIHQLLPTGRGRSSGKAGPMPAYPDPRTRPELAVILGEVHRGDERGPSPNPSWIAIPEKGLYLGTMALGAPGTGKSMSVMLPAADQIFGYMAHNPVRRVGGLVLEVKGDFCLKVRKVLEKYGRSDDYIEIGPESAYVYNPLHNDAQPTAIAYALVCLFKMLHGGTDKDGRFWDESAESLISFLVLIHRLRKGYVTLYDIYAAANDTERIDTLMHEAEEMMDQRFVIVHRDFYGDAQKKDTALQKELAKHEWRDADSPMYMRAHAVDSLEHCLQKYGIPFESEGNTRLDEVKREQFKAAKLYFEKLQKADPRTLANIAAGIENRLSIFSMDPMARRLFCPRAEAYDPDINADSHLGRPLPPLEDLIESGRVLAVRLPIAADSVLARIIGTLLKIDWQRATLNRIPKMELNPEQYFRPLAMLIDEIHLLATFGGSKPFGDESFLNLCRSAKVISVGACQSVNSLKDTMGEGWKTFLGAFQTKVCLRQATAESAKEISTMAGRVDMLRENYTVSESSSRSMTSMWSGRTTSEDGSVGLTKSFSTVRDFLIEPKTIFELPAGEAIVLANDGRHQYPPTFVYLKEWGKNPALGYFEEHPA